jgi:hypothetical protein
MFRKWGDELRRVEEWREKRKKWRPSAWLHGKDRRTKQRALFNLDMNQPSHGRTYDLWFILSLSHCYMAYNWHVKPIILIAQNEPSITKLIRTNLELLGCDAVVESGSAAALRRAAKLRPDVAFLVELMVGMRGTELGLEILRVSPKTRLVLLEFLPDDWNHPEFETLPVPFSLETLRLILKPELTTY